MLARLWMQGSDKPTRPCGYRWRRMERHAGAELTAQGTTSGQPTSHRARARALRGRNTSKNFTTNCRSRCVKSGMVGGSDRVPASSWEDESALLCCGRAFEPLCVTTEIASRYSRNSGCLSFFCLPARSQQAVVQQKHAPQARAGCSKCSVRPIQVALQMEICWNSMMAPVCNGTKALSTGIP